ncbi:hypothetical protein ACJX0J_011270, partial [Zea mays]
AILTFVICRYIQRGKQHKLPSHINQVLPKLLIYLCVLLVPISSHYYCLCQTALDIWMDFAGKIPLTIVVNVLNHVSEGDSQFIWIINSLKGGCIKHYTTGFAIQATK